MQISFVNKAINIMQIFIRNLSISLIQPGLRWSPQKWEDSPISVWGHIGGLILTSRYWIWRLRFNVVSVRSRSLCIWVRCNVESAFWKWLIWCGSGSAALVCCGTASLTKSSFGRAQHANIAQYWQSLGLCIHFVLAQPKMM